MLTKEQAENVKEQLISQLKNSELENKEEIQDSIKSMTSEQLESFLKKNKLIKESEGDCVFCSIAEEKISSYRIDENEEAIAVLEINPISKGHMIIIPKAHSKEAPKKAFKLAEEVSKKLKVFKPKKTEIFTSSTFGHEIINVLPVYKNENKDSERQKASPKELAEIQKQLLETDKEKEETEIIEQPKKEIISDKTPWLPRRIP